jgi:type I restriction enzyme S subunit
MTKMATTKDTNEKIPDGWRSVRLAEVARVISGQHILESDYNQSGRGIGYLTGPADFGATRPVITKWTEKPRVFCEPMDVLVTVKGAGVGKVNLSPDVPVAIGRQLMAIRGHHESLDRMFLFSFLITRFNHFQKNAMGATVPGLSREDLEMLVIPLPPLNEQQRIAAVLREQMAAVAKARASAQARLEAVKTLPASLLRQVFPQPNQPLPADWRVLPLGDTGEVVSGVTIGRAVDGEGIREVPYLRVANVKDGYLDLLDMVTTSATPGEIEALKLRQGDLLLTEGGDPDKLGRGTLWEGQLPECIHQNHIFRVRLNRNLVEPTYAAALIGSSYGKGYFLRHAKQTTGIATINQRVLKAFPILLPPLSEQRRIAGVLKEQMAAVEKARAAAEEELQTISALPAALLRRAFNGEL